MWNDTELQYDVEKELGWEPSVHAKQIGVIVKSGAVELGGVARADDDIEMEQTRVADGIWMPERVEVRAAAKIFFVKSLVIDRVLTYSEYRLAEAGVPATGDPVIP